jgi:hypothetical protein
MQRSHLGSLIAAGAIALGTMMTLTAPSAIAMPREAVEARGACTGGGGSFWSVTDAGATGISGYICQWRHAGITYRNLYNSRAELGATCEWVNRSYRNCAV